VFSCVWLDRQLLQLGAGFGVRMANVGWCTAIVLSTMATRQHVALDVVAGLALGLAFARLPRAWISRRL
jgi:putative Ca2+/H+ antiporter (TMEM165/GDT1 family)